MKDLIEVILGVILIVVLVGIIQSMFFWGLGLLILKVFEISYTWTFWHGFVTAIVVDVLAGIFKTTITTKKD